MEQNSILLQEKNDSENEDKLVIDNVETNNTKPKPAIDLFEDDIYVWSLLLFVEKKV